MDRLGILTLTHGTGEENSPSNQAVIQSVAGMGFPVPTAHGFISAGRHAQPAVALLDEASVDVMVAVLLYPLSNNKEVGKTYVELGLKPGKLKYEFYPVATRATVYTSKLLEAHPTLADACQERMLALSDDPANEIGVIITHGEFTAGSRKYHEGSIDEIAGIIRDRGAFADVRRASINPKDETLPLAESLLAASDKRLLFTHFFTERSDFTEQYIPSQLAKLPADRYRWNSAPMLASGAMREYILFRVAETLIANGRNELVFDEARECWDRYRDFTARHSLPILVGATV
jgi:hypothetical protein